MCHRQLTIKRLRDRSSRLKLKYHAAETGGIWRFHTRYRKVVLTCGVAASRIALSSFLLRNTPPGAAVSLRVDPFMKNQQDF